MKQGKVITIVLIVLALAIALLAYINKDLIVEKQQLNNDAVFAVIQDDITLKSYTMSEIASIGAVTFDANLKSNGQDSVAHSYTGVLLKDILIDAGLNPSEGGSAIVSAIDGYVVGVTNEKLMDDSNVYLAYMKDGVMIGTREEGGDGPYQMIISKDNFSQYWCKYAYSVELK